MKRWAFYFVGLFIAALGISSIIAANLGTAAWDTVFVGLTNSLGLTPGTWNIIIGGIVLFINAFLAKEKPDFPAFGTVFLLGIFIDLHLFFLSYINFVEFWEKLALFLFGFTLFALGAGMYLQAKISPTPFDKLMLVIHKRFGYSLAFSRFLCEATALLSGFLLSGPVSYGTVFVVSFMGPSVQYTYRVMETLYNSMGIPLDKEGQIQKANPHD